MTTNNRELRTIAIVILWVGFLSACASYRDARSAAPGDSILVAAPADPLSDCVLDKLMVKYATNWNGYAPQKTKEGSKFRIIVTASAMGSRIYAWDYTFVPLGPNQTRIEARSTKTVWGYYNYPSDVWAVVDACGMRVPG